MGILAGGGDGGQGAERVGDDMHLAAGLGQILGHSGTPAGQIGLAPALLCDALPVGKAAMPVALPVFGATVVHAGDYQGAITHGYPDPSA